MMKAHDILAKARDILFERAKDRDVEEERAMARTVAIFAAWTGQPLTELQGWQFMTCLKMARGAQGDFRLDDVLDRIGYAALEAEHASEIVGTRADKIFLDEHAHQVDQALNGTYTFDPKNPSKIHPLPEN